MSSYMEERASVQIPPAEPFRIEIQYTHSGAILLGTDLNGNLLATRTLTSSQLGDTQLTSLVTADLETTLRALVKNADIFPPTLSLQHPPS